MRKRDYRDYLNDILDSISDIENFTSGMTLASFKKDKKTIYAVIRCIEVIGEASQKIPKSVKGRHQGIPWTQISGMRNKMIHEYFGVDINILWQTIREDIPRLNKSMNDIKLELKGGNHSGQDSSTGS